MCDHASPQHNWVASVNHLHHQKLARDFWPDWTCEHALHVSGDVASMIFELENCQKRLSVGPAARPSVPILFRHGFSTGIHTGSLWFTTRVFYGFLRITGSPWFPSKSSKQWFCLMKKFKMGLKRCCQMNPIFMQRVVEIRIGKASCPFRKLCRRFS